MLIKELLRRVEGFAS